jgi:hypothetical protein
VTDALKDRNGRPDILRILSFIVPFATLALIGFLFLNGMMETPSQRQNRTNGLIDRRLSTHIHIAGHPVMVERVAHFQTDIRERIDAIEESVRQMKEQVSRNAIVLARIEARQKKNGP